MKIILINNEDNSDEHMRLITHSAPNIRAIAVSTDLDTAIEQVVSAGIDHETLFVGISAASWWANYAAQINKSPCILVDPCVSICDYLCRRTGKDANITPFQVVEYVNIEKSLRNNIDFSLIHVIYTVPASADTIEYFAKSASVYSSVSEDSDQKYIDSLISVLTYDILDAIIN